MLFFKKKVKVVNEDGVEEVYKVKSKETLTKETLEELSNNKGSDDIE